MSLINKMLQDLDARGGAPRHGHADGAVRAVPQHAPGRNALLVAALALLSLLVLAAAATWWWTRARAPAAEAGPQPRIVRQVQAAAVPLPAAVAPAAVAAAPPATPPEQTVDMPVLAVAPAAARPARPMPAPATAPAARGPVKPLPAAPVAVAAATRAPAAADSSPQQRAAALFQRAQVNLVDARVSEAMAHLEAVLVLDPAHEGARQTLASLLVENGRGVDAMRHLQQGLALDPRNAGMAMLLARLQVEHGGPALDTLERSLPYAQQNAGYRALMAGILQRAQRHAEAIEHYAVSVRLQPANSVWWMGMGISLLAEQRKGEARDAFLHARDSGQLAPELQAFVERKLQTLL